MATIKEHIVRARSVMEKQPSIGLGEKTATTRLIDGLSCITEEGPWSLQTDMPAILGGTEAAPSPGMLARAALGSCLVTSYAMWAAQLNIPIKDIQVTITASFDDGALLGANDNPAGFSKVKYRIIVDSDASEEDIIRVLDMADKHSPLLDVFNRNQNCEREVQFITL